MADMALQTGLIEMTFLDKRNNRLRKYHCTVKGRQWPAQNGDVTPG